MRSYQLPRQTFELLANMAAVYREPDTTPEIRKQFRFTIKNEMLYAGFSRSEHTEWAFSRVHSILEDEWQSAQQYFSLRPSFSSSEYRNSLGRIINCIVGGRRPSQEQAKSNRARWLYEDETGLMAAFIIYVTTERPRSVA
jgi:hypothetical protein